MQNQIPHQHLRTAYIFINILLFAPVLLWPIPTFIFDNPMLNDVVIPKWHLSIIILLIASLAMDSILLNIKSYNQAIYTSLWFAVIGFIIIQNPNQYWLLALVFLIHSMRSAYYLFQRQNEQQWWLWLSWTRDISAAVIVFVLSHKLYI